MLKSGARLITSNQKQYSISGSRIRENNFSIWTKFQNHQSNCALEKRLRPLGQTRLNENLNYTKSMKQIIGNSRIKISINIFFLLYLNTIQIMVVVNVSFQYLREISLSRGDPRITARRFQYKQQYELKTICPGLPLGRSSTLTASSHNFLTRNTKCTSEEFDKDRIYNRDEYNNANGHSINKWRGGQTEFRTGRGRLNSNWKPCKLQWCSFIHSFIQCSFIDSLRVSSLYEKLVCHKPNTLYMLCIC